MKRFKWLNLPKTCDERYLEWTLLHQGVATIAFPHKQQGVFYSTQVSQLSPLNVYDNPTKWQSFGNNGWRFNVDKSNGVLVYDNIMRVPVLDMLLVWARELVDIHRTKQMNRYHQRIPWILQCPQEQEYQAQNLVKQVAGYEMAMITTNGFSNMETKIMSTNVPFLGAELTAEENAVWSRIFMTLGIPNINFKQERMIEDEVQTQTAPTELIALNGLECRRSAADKLNDRFERFLKKPIQVVVNRDNESDNYNLANNIKARTEATGMRYSVTKKIEESDNNAY